jgi:hypothetical protein
MQTATLQPLKRRAQFRPYPQQELLELVHHHRARSEFFGRLSRR